MASVVLCRIIRQYHLIDICCVYIRNAAKDIARFIYRTLFTVYDFKSFALTEIIIQKGFLQNSFIYVDNLQISIIILLSLGEIK